MSSFREIQTAEDSAPCHPLPATTDAPHADGIRPAAAARESAANARATSSISLPDLLIAALALLGVSSISRCAC